MSTKLAVIGIIALALMIGSTVAHAQGVLFVKNNNVGIGTANPTVALHIDTAGGDDFAGMGPDPAPAAGNGFNMGFGASVGGGFFNTRTGGLTDMSIATANTVRMRIFGATGNILFGSTIALLGEPDLGHPLAHNASGAHLTAGGVWTDASSRALKNDIAELSAAEAMVAFRTLNPVTFRYNAEPGEEYVGFIAEDVPALVATSDRKSLSSMDVVAVLTKVVQEQQSTIEGLSQRLAELENQ